MRAAAHRPDPATSGTPETDTPPSPPPPTAAWPWAARFALLLLGLALYGLSLRLIVNAQLGAAPWDVLHTGLTGHLPFSLGQVMIGTGLLVVGFSALALRQPVGLGTLLNATLIGMFVDLFGRFLPLPHSPAAQWSGLLLGTALLGLSTGTYVAAHFGAGPRDGLVLGLARVARWPVGRVRLSVELSVLLLGWALGGRVGLGTAAFALLSGPAMSWGLRLYGLGHPPRRSGPTAAEAR